MEDRYMIELLLDNRNGNVFDISNLVGKITWKTRRTGKAGTLEFDYLPTGEFTINSGDVLRLKWFDEKVFYGYCFEESYTKKNQKKDLKFYDQLRFLMANDTYVFINKSATQIIQQIAQDFELKIGIFEDTGYVIPTHVGEDKKLLDIIYEALDKTLIATGRTYVFYDDFGLLNLRSIDNLKQNIVIDGDSNLMDFTYKKSIDSDTYNRIKLVQNNNDGGKRDIYIVQDSQTIAKWGLLQYYQSVNENLNKAQIKEISANLLKVKNRETKTLKVDVVGTDPTDVYLRAGAGVYIKIQELEFSQFFLIDEATHKFSNGEHTFNLNLKVV